MSSKSLNNLSLPPSQFLVQNQESLGRLLSFITFANNFDFGIIEVNSPSDLDIIIKAFINSPKCQKIQFWLLNLDDPELKFFRDEMVKRLAEFTIESDKKLVIVIQGLENAISLQGDSPFLANLNYIRDLLPRDIPYPILFCLPTYAVNRLAKIAPDLWSWISVYTFKSVDTVTIPETSLTQSEQEFISKPQEEIPIDIEERIDFLSGRLAEYYQSNDDSVKDLFYLLSELGFAYLKQQDLEKAENYLQQAEDLYQQNLSLSSTIDEANLNYNLGRLYQDKVKGSRVDNLEKVISYYQLALQFYTRDAFPYNWAVTQNNLGNAYSDRIAGNRSENREKAITCYQLALEEWRQDNVPLQWASTQNNLGNAYSDRIDGNRSENLEKAIACYELALEEMRQDNVPLQWASTQNNLATAYRNRIAGNRRENLEKAIACYRLALEEMRQDNVPLKWAMTQNNLATAYLYRIAGDRSENIEKVIACYELALEERRQDNVPLQWASTQNNLGNAYSDRIDGNRSENLEKAIACYELALEEWRQDNVPLDWAMTQNNLATAYLYRIAGDRRENLEKAIACYQLALEEWRQDNVPLDWAMTQNNLATAYLYRIAGDRKENREKAIACYELALEERRQDNVPLQWAATQNNLGNAYSDRIAGNRRENLEKAIQCYENALEGYEVGGDKLQAAEIALILGKIYTERGEWYHALEYLEKSLAMYGQLDDFKSRADAIYQIAHVHHLIGNDEKASVHYRDALRLYEYLNYSQGIAFCKASLGRLLLQIGIIEDAKKQLEEAKIIFREINNQKQITAIEEVINRITKIKEKQAV